MNKLGRCPVCGAIIRPEAFMCARHAGAMMCDACNPEDETMITIPLRPVLAYLIRHGVSPDVLDGAPYSLGGTVLGAWNGRPYEAPEDVPEQYALYLGTGEVCPAAMGWAVEVLKIAHEIEPDVVCQWEDQYGTICLSAAGIIGGRAVEWVFGCWAADHGETYAYLTQPAPPTPAERLRAVLVYEMGRA